ncbi:MAG: hypothetical protein A3F31_02035 [Candidatus Levybacteria bacterium RIFCSPHIGHO2_12_FULL_38_12]|nr:MAG: hypothetical protein A2770_03990 [Candidatus Levybacteria bacterium RIFCSPHIGHO2_01_FULL_38_12]OGH22241.1 MAG: hypothetical protein A3F31_02035 [Candidatus Levybacteria bacterium RIFCSPHIGHO2_12_FULL_38_12]OGH43891.1 MAG: hypothetical protein A3J14_04735 [Candidatus Levybacteria bacterium RIFCSPLOWO2_02_FULL_37_18]
MKKLLKPKDILLLTLAGVGDVFEEVRDPLKLLSSGYEIMYGFTPRRYKRNNYYQVMSRLLKTGNIEKVIQNDQVYLRLTASGNTDIKRDFPLLQLSRKWNKKWILVLFDIEEKTRGVRDRLRLKLKNLGFGMLQKSIWVTPLPIGKEMIEFIQTNGLQKEVYVLEVSHVLFGDPKALARKVWELDKVEEKFLEVEEKIQKVNLLIENLHDRKDKREAKMQINVLKVQLRGLRRKRLEIMVSLPFLIKELLPEILWKLF